MRRRPAIGQLELQRFPGGEQHRFWVASVSSCRRAVGSGRLVGGDRKLPVRLVGGDEVLA